MKVCPEGGESIRKKVHVRTTYVLNKILQIRIGNRENNRTNKKFRMKVQDKIQGQDSDFIVPEWL